MTPPQPSLFDAPSTPKPARKPAASVGECWCDQHPASDWFSNLTQPRPEGA